MQFALTIICLSFFPEASALFLYKIRGYKASSEQCLGVGKSCDDPAVPGLVVFDILISVVERFLESKTIVLSIDRTHI